MTVSALAMGLLAQGASWPRAQVVPPRLPLEAVTGGEVLLKASVSPVGHVRNVEVLKHSPAFTEALESAVRQWRFGPAEDGTEHDVLVAGMFRPPTLIDVATPAPPAPDAATSAAVPVPTQWERPPYPPQALGDGVVVIEMRIGADGTVEDMEIVHSSPAFDAAAKETARRWSFRPAVRAGTPVESLAYLVFGFRQPVVAPRPGGRT